MKAIRQTNDQAGTSASEMGAPLLRSLPRSAEAEEAITKAGPRIVDAMIVNPLADPQWDEWISNHPDSTIFHSSAWARVLVETYGHRPCYVQVSANNTLLALVPMMEIQSMLTRSRGVCLPFSDYCAPLFSTTFGKDLVVQKLRQIGRERGWNYFEVRSGAIIPADAPVSARYYGHSLDLRDGGHAVYSKFASSAQRAVRKAERCGLSASIRPDAMDQFYKLHVRTRHRLGVPPQPRAFFASIERNIINAGLGFIVLVEDAQRAVAAAIFFKIKGRAVYKFGASDERAQEFRPNNLLMSEAIKFLVESGSEMLHFGRTDIANEGLRRFKLSWGAKEEEICYGKFSILADSWVGPRNHRLTFHNRIFRALPVSVNRLAGVLLYPHLD